MMRQYELVEKVQSYNPATNEDLLNRAYVYAMRAHGNQKRASGDPYFSHPLEVAAILTEYELDDATIATALLHDVIEDTEATKAEIDQRCTARCQCVLGNVERRLHNRATRESFDDANGDGDCNQRNPARGEN